MASDSVPSSPAAGAVVRYRCEACGNITRFDVTSTRRTTAFHHYSVGGELSIEAPQVLNETVEDVSCRWCGNGSSVVRYAPAEASDDDSGVAEPGPGERRGDRS